jgi:NADPH:quinone reductase-like Zn-dependent oxidoreductase
MAAIRIKRASSTSSTTLQLTTVPRPTPKADQVVVQIKASAMHPSDRLNARGGFDHTSFPRIPGRDFAGIIVDGPPDRIGEQVFGTSGTELGFSIDGPHAEYCSMPAELAVTKPRTLSFVQAAAVGVPFTTALLCLTRARVTSQDTVLVLGATGAVGSAAVQVARALGCRRVITAARRGAPDIDLTVDPQLKTVPALTDGKGPQVIIDTIGSLELLQAGFDVLAKRGRYAFIAAPRGPGASTIFGLDVFRAYRREIELIGCNSAVMSTAEVNAALAVLKDWFDKGKLVGRPEEEYETVSLLQAKQLYQQPGPKPVVITMGQALEVEADWWSTWARLLPGASQTES